MSNFIGVIIEESLEDKSVLKGLNILSTKIEPVTEKKRTPWVNQWTLHTIEIDYSSIRGVAERLSEVIDNKHKSSWYIDFKNESTHYIIFRNKVFEIDRTSRKQYEEANLYGLNLGIPEYQMEFGKYVIN